MARSFNAVSFVGGPLDGVCWPCIVNPDAMAFKTADGRIHCYECDRVTECEDGTADYRMVPALDAESFWEEFLGVKGKP